MYDNDSDIILENKIENNLEEGQKENFEEYEVPFIPIEEMNRIQQHPGGFNPNFQPPNFPGNNFPGVNNPGGNFPGGNNPSGNINPSQLGAPPNHIPNKNDKGVKFFNASDINKAVSQNSIRFCLFQFTFIWERNGRSYWTYLLNVDRVSVSGLRWFNRRWVFFGLDLRRIDSFICYRTNCENCLEDDLYRSSKENSFKNKKKLYTNSEIRESLSKTLASLDIPETKEDFIVKTVGVVDGNQIQSSIPCIKARNTNYTINLEIIYPENLDENIKDKIIEYANESANETTTIINSSRSIDDSLNPLETFDNYTKLISKALTSFSSEFNSKLRNPEIDKDVARSVTYSINHCKVTDDWKTKI